MNNNNTTIANPSRSLAIFSPDVPDLSTLVNGLEAGVEALILNPNGKELQQIADALRGGNYNAVHIFSHGAPGQIFLGQTTLSGDNIDEYAEVIQEWRQGLAPGADILLYGCNVALNIDEASEQVLHEQIKSTTND